MNSRFLLIATAAILLVACNGKTQSDAISFTINGTLENASNKTLYIEEMTPDNGARFIDSIKCDRKGHFKFSASSNYQTFYNLHTSLYDYIVLLPSDGETISVTGNADNLETTYHVEGSSESQLMWQIQSYVNDANNTIAQIAEQDKANRANLNDEEYKKAHEKTDSIFVNERKTVYLMFYNFINDNHGSLSTLYAIDAPFNHSMRVFYSEPDFEVFEYVLEGLEQNAPNNPHTQYYRTRVERERSARTLAQQEQQTRQQITF